MLLRKAYLFSAMAHEGAVRKSGEPYLTHPMAVADILADLKMDDIGIIAGFLHDVVEDNHSVTLDNIRKSFGEDVAHIVDAVTKIETDIPLNEPLSKEEAGLESLRKLILAMTEDIRVIFVKIADRLHNLRTMEGMPPSKARVKAEECLQIFAPIAHRLGLGMVKNELEDLSFRYAFPEDYGMIRTAIQEKRQYSTNFIEEIKGQIVDLMRENSLRGEIQGRTKHLYSIYKKLLRQNIDIKEVYDYMAFRILVPEEKDCYAVMGLIHTKWNIVPGRLKDFISNPKENGYRSLHTSVIGPSGQPFEIQIRTYQMHDQAEHGIAAHWKYKEGKVVNEDDENLVKFRKEISDSLQTGGRDFLQNLHLDLYPKDIYAITPKGKIIQLPRGSTTLDFAYYIHTEVGNRFSGAKINGKMVPMRTELKSGDRVEINTSPITHPSRDWLDVATTSRAKSKIRNWLTQNEKGLAIERGKEVFDRELRRFKVSLKDLAADRSLEEGLRKSALPDIDSLYSEIGYGKIDARGFLKRLLAQEEPEAAPGRQAQVRKNKPIPVSAGGDTDFVMNYAKCCNPVEGDPIQGYITKGKGLVIHRASCFNVRRLMELHPERASDVSWEGRGGDNIFDIPLAITVKNKRGILADVTKAISDENADIVSMDAKSLEKQGQGEKALIKVKVLVRDRGHLGKLISRMSDLDGMVSITRSSS